MTDNWDGDRTDAASPEKVDRIAAEFDARGTPYARVTVVRREPPVSANVGDRALVTADGDLVGWIGGAGCAQSVVEREATAALRDGEPVLVGLSPDPDDVDRPGVEPYPMTCHSGGTLELFVEPVSPTPRLVVVGESPVARTLAGLADQLTYQVTAVTDPGSAGVEGATETVPATDAASVAAAIDGADYVVVASMGEYDRLGVTAGLRTGARYVGLVASDERRDAVAAAVADRLGADAETVAGAVTTAAGLAIGAETAEEIAVSILAELVGLRREADGPIPLEVADATVAAAGDSPAGDPGVEPGGDPPAPPERQSDSADGADATADGEPSVDPVCGMEVADEAAATVEHRGETYRFCGEGCAEAFAEAPERYLDGTGVTADD